MAFIALHSRLSDRQRGLCQRTHSGTGRNTGCPARSGTGRPAAFEPIDPTYQWPLPMPSPGFERRTYFWIPARSKHVASAVVSLQSMPSNMRTPQFKFSDARQRMV